MKWSRQDKQNQINRSRDGIKILIILAYRLINGSDKGHVKQWRRRKDVYMCEDKLIQVFISFLV